MKRIVFGAMAVILFSGFWMMAGAQTEPSLGDYARSLKKNKPEDAKSAAKVYDNDNLPSTPSISVVGGSSPAAGTAAPSAADTTNQTTAAKTGDNGSGADAKATADADRPPAVKPGESIEDRKKTIDAWKDKIGEQKRKIDQLAKELDDFQHSGTMPTTAVWPYNEKYAQGLADKQKALDQAKSELSALQDQARKAGAPNSVIE